MSLDGWQELEDCIAASLWIKPATFDELMDRDFLEHRSPEGVDRILDTLERNGAIYYRPNTEKYHCYKSHLKALNSRGMELE